MGFVNAGLARQFGEGRWVIGMSGTGFIFDEPAIKAKGLDADAVYAAAKQLVEQVDGVQVAFTRAQLAGTDTTTPYLAQMRKSWYPGIAAPLQVVPKAGWMFGSRFVGTTHGSPYENDTHVPLLTCLLCGLKGEEGTGEFKSGWCHTVTLSTSPLPTR